MAMRLRGSGTTRLEDCVPSEPRAHDVVTLTPGCGDVGEGARCWGGGHRRRRLEIPDQDGRIRHAADQLGAVRRERQGRSANGGGLDRAEFLAGGDFVEMDLAGLPAAGGGQGFAVGGERERPDVGAGDFIWCVSRQVLASTRTIVALVCTILCLHCPFS